MEYASVLAGERFTDRPRCAHPVLAAVARAVNDAVSDQARATLLPRVADVIGAGKGDPRLGPRLVRLCTQRALEAQRRHHTCFANGCGSARCAHRQWLRAAHHRAARRLSAVEQAVTHTAGVAGRSRAVVRLVRSRLYDASAEHVISLAVSVVARADEHEALRLLADCLTTAQLGSGSVDQRAGATDAATDAPRARSASSAASEVSAATPAVRS